MYTKMFGDSKIIAKIGNLTIIYSVNKLPLTCNNKWTVFFLLKIVETTWINRVFQYTLDNIILFYFKPFAGLEIYAFYLWIQNDFVPSKWFWSSTNRFGRVQFVLVRSKLYKIVQKSLILTWPKWFGPDQTIWTRLKQFGRSKIILNQYSSQL